MPEASPEPAPAPPPKPTPAAAPFVADEPYVSDLEVVDPAEARPFEAVKAKPTKRESSGGKVAVWIGAAVAVALLVTAAIVFRGAVVARLPAAQAAYAGLGLPVAGPGLVIEDIRAQPSFEGGRPVLAVSGSIRNPRNESLDCPPLRLSLLDQAGKPVATKIARPLDGRIPGHAIRHFAITLVDPPAAMRDLSVTFEPILATPAAPGATAPAAPAASTVQPEEAKPLPPEAPSAAPDHG